MRRLLFVGDIFGAPGRSIIRKSLAEFIENNNIDFVIAQGENLAGGIGITENTAKELWEAGVDCITTGNHVWKHKEIYSYMDKEPRLLRPGNYPDGVPGRGYGIYEKNQLKIAVVNLEGRVFMNRIEDPFRVSQGIIAEVKLQTNNIFIDFHAEATSEKKALFYYLAGTITAFIGTHTHVPTADEHVQNGTAYITDVGMAGVFDSVIGVEKDLIIKNYLTGLPQKYEPAKGGVVVNTVTIEFDEATGRAASITRHNF